MRYALSVFFVLLSFSGFSQTINDDPFKVGNKLVDQNNYLKAADTVLMLQKNYYAKHNLKIGIGRPQLTDQAVALFQSFIGEEYLLHWKKSKVRADEKEKVEFVPALEYIIKQAENKRVVMINEDHNTPKHRLLTYNLLEDFYKQGFRYLAVEALELDSAVVNLGYPKISSGAYLPEPNMGNLLKKAIKLGFKVLPYESDDDTEYDDKNPFYAQNLREVDQAKNICQILLKDPEAKILVHAGPGHIWEKGGGIIFMAEYFKKLSGIDPFTINQSVNSMDEYKDKLDLSLNGKSSAVPYVVLNEKGIPKVAAGDKTGAYDLLVAWPSAKFVSGRKDFQLVKKNTTLYPVKVNAGDAGNLLQIRSLNPDDDIPIDQFVIKKGVLQYATALESGSYRMQLINKQGVIIWKRDIAVQ